VRRQLSVRLLAPLIELTYSRATARRAERERFSNTAVGSYKMHRWLRTELPAVIRVEDRDGVVRHRGPHRLKLVQRLTELVVRPLVYVRTNEPENDPF
jgi:hypothetical protein